MSVVRLEPTSKRRATVFLNEELKIKNERMNIGSA